VLSVLGAVDTEHDTVTEWPLPFAGSGPLQPSGGAVYLLDVIGGRIGQFDLQTQVLRLWVLPLDFTAVGSVLDSLALDGQGGVFFSAVETSGPSIGHLDTTNGRVDTWPFSLGGVPDIVTATNGSLVLAGSSGIATFDSTAGVFTVWPTDQPPVSSAADSQGNLYFEQVVNDPHADMSIVRLVPSTGRLTRWQIGYSGAFFLADQAGRAFFTNGQSSLHALDPAAPGQDTMPTPTVSAPVTPRTTTATWSETTLVGKTVAAPRSVRTIRRLDGSPLTWWDGLPGAQMVATVPGEVYVVENWSQTLARLND
jgi:streptogramin lyase